MKNKGIWLVVAIVVVLIVASGNFIKFPFVAVYNGGEINVNNNCNFATDTFTEGAVAGQCYVRSDDRPVYVESVVQSQRTGASGLTDFCKIQTCYSCDNIFTCPYASKYDGTQVKICKLDSECTSNKCVNNLCKEGMPSGECGRNQVRCFDNTHYQQCLYTNYEGHWSGKLLCPEGNICSGGQCVSTTAGTGCSPRTCGVASIECGTMSDNCGNTVNCGTCLYGKTCSNGICTTPSSSSSSSSGGSSSSSSGGGTTSNFDWNMEVFSGLPLWGLLTIIGGIFLLIILVKKK